MDDILTLRGAVLSRYKSIGEFSDAVGWSRNKAGRIIRGEQSPTDVEIQQMAEALKISSQDVFMQIFFAPLSTMWTGGRRGGVNGTRNGNPS